MIWTPALDSEDARRPDAVLAVDAAIERHRDDVRTRVTGMLRRTLAVSTYLAHAVCDHRSGLCFAGTLAEMAFAADRSYMLLLPKGSPMRLACISK